MREPYPIYWYETVDSTNIEAERLLEKLDNMSVIATKSQSSGRGQGEHTWHSNDGENLLFSLIFKPGPAIAPGRVAEILSPALCLGILDYLRDKGIEAFVKYPNDIWVKDKKLAGILIKNIILGSRYVAGILGVGLNLNETDFPAGLPNPVSLTQLTGLAYDTEHELKEIYKKICHRFENTESEDGRNSLQEEFGKYLVRFPEGL